VSTQPIRRNITIILFLCFIVIGSFTYAQCNTNISSFPYTEGFENTDGNWFVAPASVNPDWAWGTPAKTIINTAGNGSKCWIIGGLNKTSYNNGEESYLQSPCFDISSLQNPIISFKIFWATEAGYDGAGFQYSTDGGNTWVTLGSVTDFNTCPTDNWFNTSSIKYLNTIQGWSGSSNQWVTAQHSLSDVKGITNIVFRFVFGAGTINNNYNGVAIDDIFIGEAPAFNPVFNYTCAGNKTIDFTDTSTNCPNSFLWNFGDPSSGVANTDNHENPTHKFSASGTYTITLTASSATTTLSNTQMNISVLDVSITSNDISCNNKSDGLATAIPSGSNGSYTYLWNTNPVAQTQTINNLTAGTYSVTINTTNACAATATTTISEPTAIIANTQVTNEICSNVNGTISAIVSGGTPPYIYTWSNDQTTPTINNLTAGVYSLHITDKNNCSGDSINNIIVSNSIQPLHLFLGNDTSICPGQQLILNAGNFSSYLWQDNSTGATYPVTTTGTYSVKVNDNKGCSGLDSISVIVDCSDIYFPSAFTPNSDGLNDLFGAEGNIATIKNYSLTIYNRWGEIIFQSNDPLQKWNGKYKGSDSNAGTFVWLAKFIIANHPSEIRKGTITLLR